MRTPHLTLLAGLAALAGCHDRPAGRPAEARPAGDGASPADEFQAAHRALEELQGRMAELLDRCSGPGRLATEFPESVPLARAISAARAEVARHAYGLAVADPASPAGADAVYAGLMQSAEPPDRRNRLLDLAVRHHPDDPRLGEYLCGMMGESPPADAADWVPPLLDRVAAATASPGVRAAAHAARGKLMIASGNPTVAAAGERLLRAVVAEYPAERVGRTRVSAWAAGALAGRRPAAARPAGPRPPAAVSALGGGGLTPGVRLHQ